MTPRALLLTLFCIWVAITFGAAALLRADPEQTALEFAPDMVRGPDQDAYEPCPVFADGRTARRPVEGAVARTAPEREFTADDAGRARAGIELANPLDRKQPAISMRGEHVFQSICAVCHGAAGLGDGEVTRRGVPPPPSLLLEPARKLADGEMFHIITYGRKNMPAHAAWLDERDRWLAVAHVRNLQERTP